MGHQSTQNRKNTRQPSECPVISTNNEQLVAQTDVKTVYFHIGSIKTGSTLLQKLSYEKRNVLLTHDVDYIQFEPPRLDLPRWANADALMEEKIDVNLISSRLEASTASKILISEEGLLPRPHVWQHKIFRNYRRVIVLFLRNSVELVASWASENSLPYNYLQKVHASGQGTVSVRDGLKLWTRTYSAMLINLCKALEQDPSLEIIILPFPKANSIEESLVSAFFQGLGLSKEVVAEHFGDHVDDIANVGRTRKYCDASHLLTQLAEEYEIPFIYSKRFVDEIESKLESGDNRKVIETLSDDEMKSIHDMLIAPAYQLIEKYGAPERISNMPEIFGSQRDTYSKIDPDELRKLFLEAIVERFRRSAIAARTSS